MKILKNDYALSVVTKILTAVIALVSSMFSTRYLGVLNKGEYAYITQVANIAILILNLGIYQSYSYNYKKYGKIILQKYTDICFLQFLLLAIIGTILLVFLKGSSLFYVILLVPFNILKNQYENIVLIENLKLRMRLHIVNGALVALCYMALYFLVESHVAYIVALTVIVDIITVFIYSIKLKVRPSFKRIDFDFLKDILKFGFIPMLSSLLATINYSVDIIFLKHIGTAEELGYYALATNIINYVWMIPDAFKNVLFSRSAKKFDKESITSSSQISVSFIYLCIIGFVFCGRFLLQLVYGTEYVNSYYVTIILLFGALSMSIYKILGIVLISQGRRIAHFVSLAVSATANLILNSILIPKIGMYGAGIASVFSYTACALILLIHFTNLYEISWVQLLIPSKTTIYNGVVHFK